MRVLGDELGFGRRVALRIAFLDCRAALFRQAEGKFVGHLRSPPRLAGVFDRQEGSGGSGLLPTNLLRLRVAQLERRFYDQLHFPLALLTGTEVRRGKILLLHKDILAEMRRHDVGDVDVEIDSTPIESKVYNRCIIASVLLSTFLYLNHIYPLPSFDPEVLVRRILELQLRVHEDPFRRDTPAFVWVSSLFFAFIGTKDKIYRDWTHSA